MVAAKQAGNMSELDDRDWRMQEDRKKMRLHGVRKESSGARPGIAPALRNREAGA
jgi:hypothetical protein